MPSGSDVRAGGAFVELYTKNKNLQRGLRKAGQALKKFGASTAKVGGMIAAAGTAMLAPFIASIAVFQKVGDQLNKMAARTGASVEALSLLKFAMEQGGSNLEALENVFKSMARSIYDLNDGLETQKKAFKQLGLSAADLNDLSPDEQFRLMAKRVGEIKDPTKKAALAMIVFGKAGRAIIPMLGDIDKLIAQAEQHGLGIDAESAKAAADFADALNLAKSVIARIMFEIGAAFGDTLGDLLTNFSKITKNVIGWIKENKKLVTIVAAVAVAIIVFGTALAGVGFAIIGIGAALSALGTVLGVIGSAIGLLFTPIGLVIAVVVGLTVAFFTLTDAGGEMATGIMAAFGRAWKAVKEFFGEFSEAFGLAVDLIMAGELSAAFDVLWAGIKLTWIKATGKIYALWVEWKNFLLRIAFDAMFGLQRFFVKAWASIRLVWVKTIGFLSDAWTMFSVGIRQVWLSVTGWIAKKWLQLQALITGSSTDAAQNALDDEINRRADALADEQNERIRASAEAERKGIDAVATQERRALGALEEKQNKVNAALNREVDDAVAAAEAELAEARKAFGGAMAKGRGVLAAAGAKGKGKKKDDPKNYKPGGMNMNLPDIADAAGAFSQFAAMASLGSGGPIEKMADKMGELLNVQQGAKKELVKLNKKLGFG